MLPPVVPVLVATVLAVLAAADRVKQARAQGLDAP